MGQGRDKGDLQEKKKRRTGNRLRIRLYEFCGLVVGWQVSAWWWLMVVDVIKEASRCVALMIRSMLLGGFKGGDGARWA